jgi:hypothetical protein
MPQPRIYIDDENHSWFKDVLIKSLRDNKTVQKLGLKVDHNMAFSILRSKARIVDEESLEAAIQNFVESKR